MMTKIIAENLEHLQVLIEIEIKSHGNECDLNHISVSQLDTLYSLFNNSDFNGNISGWDVSNVLDMQCLFANSKFNGDISKWNVSKVVSMESMFRNSEFNGDISQWNVSNVADMYGMFKESRFNGDLSNWDISKVQNMCCMFERAFFDGEKVNDWLLKLNESVDCRQMFSDYIKLPSWFDLSYNNLEWHECVEILKVKKNETILNFNIKEINKNKSFKI